MLVEHITRVSICTGNPRNRQIIKFLNSYQISDYAGKLSKLYNSFSCSPAMVSKDGRWIQMLHYDMTPAMYDFLNWYINHYIDTPENIQ